MPSVVAAPIAAEACVGGRELTEPRLSPDATALVYAMTAGGESALLRRSIRPDGSVDPESIAITSTPEPRVGRGLGGGCWCWSATGDAVVYAAVDGDLWWQPADGTVARRLTAHGPDHVAQAPCTAPDGAAVVYVVDQAEVWTVSLVDGAAVRVDDGSADFCFDPVVAPGSERVLWHAWNVPNMPWDRSRLEQLDLTTGARTTVEVAGSVQQGRMLTDGSVLCIRDDHGWANLWLGDEPLVEEPFEHGGPTWGLGQRSYAVAPDGDRIAFTRNELGFGRLCVVDLATRRVDVVARGVHGQLSWAGDRLAAIRTGGVTPTQIVLYDTSDANGSWPRSTVEVGPLTVWKPSQLVEPELVQVPVDDGAVVHARLYRAEPSGGPQRLICWVHGGPTDQWQVTFMPRFAYWRSRGWNILVPDHRGSTGHGRAYTQALCERWGELDVADIATSVRFAHEQGWGEPGRTALFGSSAGGFTVLGVLRAAPGLAAAAVVAYPVADLADLLERSHRFERHSTWGLVGPPGTTPEVAARYRDRSPVGFAHLITTPLLVFHGDHDPVVPVGQSRVLAERIRTAGRQVELCVYPDEGHGFRRREHQLDEYARTEAFLRRHVP